MKIRISVQQQLLGLGFLGLLAGFVIGGFGFRGVTRVTGAMTRMGMSAAAHAEDEAGGETILKVVSGAGTGAGRRFSGKRFRVLSRKHHVGSCSKG